MIPLQADTRRHRTYGLTKVPYPMENPTARATTQATRPDPYPITVASSTSAACAANGAIAVAKAATAAVFLFSTLASEITAGALKAGLVFGLGVEKAEVHATIAAKIRATDW